MEIDENGKVRKTLLIVTLEEKEGTDPIIKWTYPDRQNAYYLIGVLEDVKDDLLSEIRDLTEEEFDDDTN